MNSNSGQNQSHSSDQNYRRNGRYYNEGNASNGRQYVNNDYNQYPTFEHQYYDYRPHSQWSSPQTFGYFNGQPFDNRYFNNYSQNYNNFNSNEMQNSYQNNESNKVENQRRHQRYQRPQQTRNYRPNNGSNDTNFGTNDVNYDNQSQTNAVNNSNVEEVLQNPSNDNSNPQKREFNKDLNKDNPKDRQNPRKEKNERYGRNDRQKSSEENVGHRVGRNAERRDEDFRGRYERNSYQRGFDENIGQRVVRSDERKDENIKGRNELSERFRRNTHQRSYDRNADKKTEKNDVNSRDNNNKKSDKKISETNKRRAKPEVPESEESQREIMEELLRKGEFECMVCCDQILIKDKVWSCEHCFNVFHLKCIKMWANSQSAKNERDSQNKCWRCPTCQTNVWKIPSVYYCFCAKMREPELNRYLVPHSCGETCGRKHKSDPNRKYNCPHKCFLRCHPGSCPPCEMKVNRECGCGKTRVTVNCVANDVEVVCQKVCNKMLNCGQHFCERICHSDKCNDCSVTKTQTCFCGQNKKEVECNVENNLIENYCCEDKCGKDLKCGNHKCEQLCHFGDCNDCQLVPKSVTHCCCGKTLLTDLTQTKRQSCLDPIPNCDQICDKELFCGSDKERHRCKSKCHSGPCPSCDQKTIIRCRCGANSDNIECIDVTKNESKTFVCKKRCNKKRVCGRHKCLNECCVDSEHLCQQICSKKLSCGLHTCQELCHSGTCPQCWNISWDELTCRCGAEVKLPPIGCGTKRPECERICSRRHACDHPIDHLCHDEEECPPCTHFTPKHCFGCHEVRPVACHETGFSCGYLCGKPLDCGLHDCQSICHSGDCNECTLPCNKTRIDCEHLCALKCHQKSSPDVCPKSNCKVMVKVFCDCSRKTDLMPCFKVNDENSMRLSLNSLVNQRIKNGESVDVNVILKNIKDFKQIQLKCDEKCALIERNRQLAEALNVKDADFNPEPGPPKYSDLLKGSAKTDPNFVKEIYEKLTKLVIDSKQSKLSFKNFNFPPMNSENRHIIHELAEHFGCKTHAIDREPNRSVVVKAVKDKCYLPTVSLMDFVREESESRKTVTNKTNKITLKSHCFDSGSNDTNVKPMNSGMTGLSMIRSISNDSNPSNKNSGQNIDYFDFRGD